MKTIITALLLSLASCVGSPPLDTPSGFPEVTTTLEREVLVENTINGLAQRGFYVTTESLHRLVMEKVCNDGTINMFMGSRMNPTVNFRAQVTFRTVSDHEQADGRIWVVTNPGSAFESLTDTSTDKAGHDLLAILVAAGYDPNFATPIPLAAGEAGPVQ